MRKRISILMLLLYFCNNSFGQEDNYDINGLSIGFVPSALLNNKIGFQGEINYGFADHYEISINAGFLYGKKKDTSYDGYRFKPSVKYYFLNDYEKNRFYIEAGYLRRVSNEQFLSTYNMFQGAFRKELINNRVKTINGIFAMYGTRMAIKNSPIYLDYGVGAGLGTITVVSDKIENGVELRDDSFFSTNSDGKRPFPIILIHLALGIDF